MADYTNTSRNISGEPVDLSPIVSFWMYHPKTDIVELTENAQKSLGLAEDEVCHLSRIESMILGVDLPCFLQNLHKWLKGNTSGVVQIRIIDCHKQMRTIQIKAHIRIDDEGTVKTLYGAYFDIGILKN
jgi:hypothetical protein